MSQARVIKFGVRDGEKRSQSWQAKITGRGEIVVMSQRTGGFFHITIHENSDHWHVKFVSPTAEEFEHRWQPTAEVLPGTIRLLRIFVPAPSIRYPAREADRVTRWVDPPSTPETWIAFTLLLSRNIAPAVVNGEVIGTLSLPDGRVLTAIASEKAGESHSVTFSNVAWGDPQAAKAAAKSRPILALVRGQSSADNSPWFLELVTDPSVAET